MTLDQDQRFQFDVQGYLHLKKLLRPAEISAIKKWIASAAKTDLKVLNRDLEGKKAEHLNRPVSRMIDADPRFGRLLDHPKVAPYLREFLGVDYRHIDNDLYFTYPGFKGGGWHRGVSAHPLGHVDKAGRFFCPMVKVFYCMSDVDPGGGEFVLVPGSHRTSLPLDLKRVDLPGQRTFDDVKTGDVIIFNEGLLHNGRPNLSTKTRKTLIINFGRRDAGVWAGYKPKPATLKALSPAQRRILSNGAKEWREPDLTKVGR